MSSTNTPDGSTKDMRHVWAGRRAAAARVRADKARAELESQGFLIVDPAAGDGDPLPDDPALVDAWGRGYHAGWRQGYRDAVAG